MSKQLKVYMYDQIVNGHTDIITGYQLMSFVSASRA